MTRSHTPGDTEALQQNLAEELHDGPLQDLVALQLKTATLARLGALGHVERDQRLKELHELAQSAIDHLHAIIRALTDGGAAPASFHDRLEELCEEFRIATGIETVWAVEADHLRLPPDVGEVVFRTVRELLTNVRKHAHASKVRVSSSRRLDGGVSISVSDDGVGMSTGERRMIPFADGGFGLWSIEQRLGAFGAFLELDGENGLRATLVLPGRSARGGADDENDDEDRDA